MSPTAVGVAGDRPVSLAGTLLSRCAFPAPAQGPVDLAVSGGPDSMALVVLAAAAGLGGRVLHVDHGLRDGSGAEAEVVGSVAAAFGFAFEAITVDLHDGPNLEARARWARYAALPAGVLTGHTLDDQAETVLLNVLRGAALDGLSGMRPPAPGRSLSLRRPLLALRRHETAELCRASGIGPLQDPSNADPRFRRNRIRSEVLPLLDDVAQRDVAPILARQAGVVAAEVALLEALASEIDPTSVTSLRAAPAPLARRALRAWLRSDQEVPDGEVHPPSLAEVDRVLDVVSGRYRACEVSGGRRVARTGGRLRIVAPDPAGTDPAGTDAAGSDAAGTDAAGRDPHGRDPHGRDKEHVHR